MIFLAFSVNLMKLKYECSERISPNCPKNTTVRFFFFCPNTVRRITVQFFSTPLPRCCRYSCGTKCRKNQPKMLVKKFVKLTDRTYACKSLTNFQFSAHNITGNGNYINLLKIKKLVKPHKVNLNLVGFT